MGYHTITVEHKEGGVGLVTLNRPKALNALCKELMLELTDALEAFDKDDTVGAMVMTGSERAFAAGADIKEMASMSYMDVYKENMFVDWERIGRLRKPVIAAVNGFCLGGGCEVACMADMIVAGDNAKFGQPEIKLGVIPGMGGTQMMLRAVGKSKAMHMILTGEMIDANEAFSAGLVARVVPKEDTVEQALAVGRTIASYSKPIVSLAKDCVNSAYEMNLKHGIQYERRLFHSAFGTFDQKEGMAAFVEKRAPKFQDK